jgi:hypothetical protein
MSRNNCIRLLFTNIQLGQMISNVTLFRITDLPFSYLKLYGISACFNDVHKVRLTYPF